MNLRSVCLLLLMPAFAAAEPALNKFSVDLSATAIQSDNAEKSQAQNSAQKISEQQSIYELVVGGAYTNDWVVFSTGYDISRLAYQKKSQPDYTRRIGNMQLDLGNNYYPLQLKLAHTNESLLNAPDALDISANREQRATLIVEPSVRWRVTGIDSLSASARATQVSYDLSAQKDSSIRAMELAWQHNFSKVNSLNLSLSSSETAFDLNPLYDYTLERAALRYNTNLRHLSYSVAVGANKVTQSTQSVAFTKPNYDLAVSYKNLFNTLSLKLDRAVSDSSSGSTAMFGNAIETTKDIDIIDVTAITLAWSTDKLCEKCAVNIYAGKNKENYQSLLEDARVKSLGASVSYRIGRKGNLNLGAGANKREFEAGSSSTSFEYKNYELGYGHQFMTSLAMNIFARKLHRDSVSSVSKYNENIAGLTLTYSF